MARTCFSCPSILFKQLVLVVAFFTSLTTASESDIVRIQALDFFHPHTLRTGFLNRSFHEETVVLLQENGEIDHLKVFILELPEEVLPDEVILEQSSSNELVLNMTNNDNLITSFSGGSAMNITCTHSFDNFVGKTEYKLTAIRSTTREVISTVTVTYIIVGITLYVEESGGSYRMVSGDGNRYSVPYQKVIDGSIYKDHKLLALIQYPDGLSTAGKLLSDSIQYGNTIETTPVNVKAQFFHDASVCSIATLGSVNQDGILQLSEGCGYGFYTDLSGNLCFGLMFQPYRAGAFAIRFSWSGITSHYEPLVEELLELELNIEITGTPPVAVYGISPDHGFLRPEGGQSFRLKFFNSDLYNISSYYIEVRNVKDEFPMIGGSYEQIGFPEFAQRLSFISQPGQGSSLNWTLLCQVDNVTNGVLRREVQSAVYVPGFSSLFTYDTKSLRIDSIDPEYGNEEGGQRVEIHGYFPFFNPDVDALYFSGVRIVRTYFVTYSENLIVITSPPRAELGSSFDYLVYVQMGYAESNKVFFRYIVKDAIVRITQSGTSEIDHSTFRVGDCTPVRFTAVVVPFTSQIQSYRWTFHFSGDTQSDLLQTSNFSSTDPSAQTLEFQPEWFQAGLYALKISVSMIGTVLEHEIFLLREHIVSIGAFILKPPDRYIASPDTPLRLSAVVTPPGECYVGNSSMIFEWEAFGRVQRFSALNTTGSPALGELTDTPARLGWEYVVPRESLTSGNHTVSFKVWMRERDVILGQAESFVLIDHSPLVAVIREGEESVTVNNHTTLRLYGNNSYDPDVLSGSRNSGLSYEWLCRQSGKNIFTVEESSPCADVLIPDPFAPSFSVPIHIVEALGDVNYIQYKLIVRKGMDRVSSTQTFTVVVQNGGSRPHLEDYSLQLNNVDGVTLDWNHVPHYEKAIIKVGAGSNITWTYELLEPSVPDFFSSSVINNPLFYSEESNIFSVSGNTKPLGIEAGKLNPSTTYRFKIVFSASTREVEATAVVLSIRTADAPTVGFPVPAVTNGTTETVFTATAGIPSTKSTFSYYFIMTDEKGNKFCLGGCTGYNVVYFQVGRVGSYEVSVLLFDMQGKALLDEATLSRNVTVHESSTSRDYQSYLNVLFNYGDDNTWTQLAHDLALKLLDSESETFAGNLSSTQTLVERQEFSPEELLAARMEYAYELSSGSRKIYCSCFPNSYHGRDCLAFALDLARQSTLDEMTVYNIIQTVDCCIKNTPLRTINLMGIEFASFLTELNRLALNLFHGGNSRRRLLSSVGEPANMMADVNNITGVQYAEAASSGKLDGFVSQIDIGSEGEYGQVTIVVASNAAHLPAQVLNGQQRKIIMGPSGNEMFYATEECLRNVFSTQGDERFVFVFHTTDNFVLLGFQDPPIRSNLADSLYWTQVYRRSETGEFVPAIIPDQDFCFCWRLPVLRKVQHLANSTEDMPGLYAISRLKPFNESVFEKGSEFFSYVYENSKTVDYNVTEGWVEACRREVGLISTTVVARTEQNILINVNNGRILGFQASIIVGLVLGGLLLLVVALAASWMIAVRAMSNGLVPLASTVPSELFVERDVYGRGTILDANAMTLPETNQ
eukprot:TRINITY_DN3177_c0_g1_i1.p1 TRINITY_DN3177_c0_g1~~TRINITY_DN3177_c0_g1_i1.p1  ORF type:complete len:1587 (-),score=181.04 TRINITY_DN3177_c0_g1_i1:851-5611(-)